MHINTIKTLKAHTYIFLMFVEQPPFYIFLTLLETGHIHKIKEEERSCKHSRAMVGHLHLYLHLKT